MKRFTTKGTRLLLHTMLLLALLVMTVAPASATSRSFGANSYIISADNCWQPNNDPNKVTQPAVCDTNKNDESIFQVYGLLYALLDTGDQPSLCINNDGSMPQQKAMFGYCKQIRVYWIIDSTKTDPQAADMTLASTDPAVNTTGIITIYNSPLTKAGTTTASVPYKGGPFVIDVNDITTAEMDKIKAKFPTVKIHKANIPFSGNVDKILIGKPPKIAVLNEGSSDVLEDYIRAAGSFAWRGTVFQYISARDIIAGCLQDPIPASCKTRRTDIVAPFQLIWAPHWEIENKWYGESSSPSAADQTSVVREIRSFLERGNSGFFECASIGSLEAALSRDNIGTSVAAGVGGYLIDKAKTSPRIQTNGGCFEGYNHATMTDCSTGYLKFEQVPFWLTQCGGWKYKPTSGLIDSMRPVYDGTTPANSYFYHTTQSADDTSTTVDDRYVGTQLTRFIHDNSANIGTSYTNGTNSYHVYDYLIGGRINGAPNQGYVIYFPGHKYISCSNSTTYSDPPSRSIDFQFDGIPLDTDKITIELVHAKCTHGTNCPTIQFDLTTNSGTNDADSWVSLSSEFAAFDTGTKRLSGVFFSSSFSDTTLTQLQISDLYVTFNGNAGAVKLSNVSDVTQAGSRQVLCNPNQTSLYPISAANSVRCNTSPANAPVTALALTFDGDVAVDDGIITVKLPTSSGTLMATYNTLTSTASASSTVGNLTLDVGAATYDADQMTLSNILLKRGGTCAKVDLTDIQVQFPGAGIHLVAVTNTSTNEVVCSPEAGSIATCSGRVIPPPSPTKINTSLSFNYNYLSSGKNSTNIGLTLKYTCSPACSTNSLSATFTTSAIPNTGQNNANSDLRIDMSAATLSGKILSNIALTNLDGNKQLTITEVSVTYQSSKQLKTFKDTTNNVTIASWYSGYTSPQTKTGLNYLLKDNSVVIPPSTWTYTIGAGICSYYLGPYLSSCGINWAGSNTCGIKYVLNTFLALKYQSTSSEFTKTQPIVKDNILYKASYDYPAYRGHLKMIKVPTDSQAAAVTVWDAASTMPEAGDSGFPSQPISSKDASSPRYIFTSVPGSSTHVAFDEGSSATLKTYLGAATDNDATVIINTVRGRLNASTSDVYGSTSSCTGTSDGTLDLQGCSEDSKRLWAIENSTPALKTKSKYVESTATAVTATAISSGRDRRDRILFAGADDGMMHAFWAGTYDPSTGTYPDTAAGRGTGKEIWAYIPSALLSNLKNQPFNPDPNDEASFEPKVSVDGSPALGDFLMCTDKNTVLNTCNKWEWKTRLVGTAMVRSENRGIVFALDVTDPYNPQLLWESSYNVTTDSSCSGTSKNCNMGNSKGVSIGTAQIGDQLKDYVFLTSSWINKKKVKEVSGAKQVDATTKEYLYETCAASDTSPSCVYGVSAYALDLDTGKVMWERSLPYSGDASGINETPAVPALMDRDNNGSYDYVVFGDMQGRLWALRTTDGKNLTDLFSSSNHESIPVYQLHELNSSGLDTTTLTGAKEPIGASVSVYRDYVILATGGADTASNGSASDSRAYRIEVVKIGINGGVKDNNQTVLLTSYDSSTEKGSEKVWAKPAITSDLKVYVGTARSYFTSQTVSTLQSDGRVIVIDLKTKRDAGVNATNATSATSGSNVAVIGGTADQWQSGGFVGGFDFDNKHAYIIALKPTTSGATKTDILQIGGNDFTPSANKTNPYKILWWRKL